MKYSKHITKALEESEKIKKKFVQNSTNELLKAAGLIHVSITNGGKVLVFGNGGSAADAQHFAAEMVGKFQKNRAPFPTIALTTDSSVLTAIANDYDYSYVFSRQVEALARHDDVIIAISTSGNSKNVLNGVKQAEKIGCDLITLSGGGQLSKKGYVNLVTPGSCSGRIQETHIFILHCLVGLVELLMEDKK